jgi:hypothetical protein
MAELFDILLAELRSAKSSVNRIVGIGALFALLSHFYVVEPYFQYKAKEASARAALPAVTQKMEATTAEIERIKQLSTKIRKSLDSIGKDIDAFPDRLREVLPRLQAALQRPRSDRSANEQPFLQNQTQRPQAQVPLQQSLMPAANSPAADLALNLPPQVQTFEEAVRWYSEDWFEDLLARVDQELVTPLAARSEIITPEQTSALAKAAQGAVNAIRGHIAGIDPDFWRHYGGPGGKVDVAQQLRREVGEAFKPVNQKVLGLVRQTETAKEALDLQLATIQSELQATRNSIDTLSDRVKSIESPFGRLPLDLTDLIVLFPFILAITTVLLTTSILKTVRIFRDACRTFPQRSDHDDLALLREAVGSWYLPPFRNIIGPVMLIVWYLTAGGIYARAGSLIFSSPDIFTAAESTAAAIRPRLFAGAYAVGFAAILAAGVLTARSLFQTAREMAQDRPSSMIFETLKVEDLE